MSSGSNFCLLSCGSNAHGQLGSGSMEDSHAFQRCSFEDCPPQTLPVGARIIDIATGANHTLLLLEINDQKRELWGSGDGRKGQLGLKYQQTETHNGLFRRLDLALREAALGDYDTKSISATWETSYAVLSRQGCNDVVISMGSDDYGDLGIGGFKQNEAPQDFHIINFDHLSSLSEKFNILGIYSGQRHTILHVNTISGQVLLGWGTSRHGQLGAIVDTPFASVPRIIPVNSENIVSLGLGIHHTSILYTSGNIGRLGSNRKSQLEVINNFQTEEHKARNIGCTWNGTYVATQNEKIMNIYSSGSNSHSQLGWKSDESAIVGNVVFPDDLNHQATCAKIACGSEHILVLDEPSFSGQTRLWGWGWNEHGNLGVGHTADVPTPIILDPIPGQKARILNVWAGLGTSWIFAELISS